jgi:hypothetical protein
MKILTCCGVALLLLSSAGVAKAQRGDDFERSCRQEVANRFRVERHDVEAQNQGENYGKTKVVWKVFRRSGLCEYDRQLNLVNFKEFGEESERHEERSERRDDDYAQYDREQMISDYFRVRADTGGRGSFNTQDRGPVRITRGWVDTTGEPAIALSGEHDFRISFRGEIIRSNGEREFTMRIRGSDRGEARGIATFRLNRDRNEVEFISINGRLNGEKFDGNFNR